MQHVIIRPKSYVAGMHTRPEVGIFTQTHDSRPPVPWGKLGVGDPVSTKWSETQMPVGRVASADLGERAWRLGRALGQVRESLAA